MIIQCTPFVILFFASAIHCPLLKPFTLIPHASTCNGPSRGMIASSRPSAWKRCVSISLVAIIGLNTSESR